MREGNPLQNGQNSLTLTNPIANEAYKSVLPIATEYRQRGSSLGVLPGWRLFCPLTCASYTIWKETTKTLPSEQERLAAVLDIRNTPALKLVFINAYARIPRQQVMVLWLVQ